MNPRIAASLVVLCLSTPVWAQLVSGEIAVSGFSVNQFTVLSLAGTPTSYNIGAFGGALSQSILADPRSPNTVYVGGVNFLGRAVVTGPGMATYTQLVTMGTAAQMSFDLAGQIIVAEAANDQVVRVDPATGMVTPITSGPQPWGADLNAGSVDPSNGDIYIGGNNTIHRIPAGSSTAVPFASGWAGGTSFVSGIAFDPFTSEVVATLLTVNRFVRISPAGAFTDLITPGSITGMNSVAVDLNGDFIVGASGGNVFRVPNGGGMPALIGTATGQGTSASGVSVINGEFFRIVASAANGGGLTSIRHIPAGTTEGWLLPSLDTSLPVNQGPVFGFNPDSITFMIALLSPNAIPGFLFHWTWPVSPPLFPAAPFTIPTGTFMPGLTIDVIAIAFGSGTVTISPVTRVTY